MTVPSSEKPPSADCEERDDRFAPPPRKAPPKRSYTRRRVGTKTVPGQRGVSVEGVQQASDIAEPERSSGPTAPPTMIERSSPFHESTFDSAEPEPDSVGDQPRRSAMLPIQQSPFHRSARVRGEDEVASSGHRAKPCGTFPVQQRAPGRVVPKTLPLAPAATPVRPERRRVHPTVVEHPAANPANDTEAFKVALERTRSAPGLMRSPFVADVSADESGPEEAHSPVPTLQAGISAWGSRADELPPDNETSQRFSTTKKPPMKTKQLAPPQIEKADGGASRGAQVAPPVLGGLRRELARSERGRTPRWLWGVGVAVVVVSVLCVGLIGWALAG